MFNLFDDLDNLFNSNSMSTDFFTSTDIKTILGRNIVLNFLGKIEMDIKTQGYSNTANDIADFYEKCKSSGGIIEFLTNPVIKMILNEIKYKPTLKSYLNARIFEDIEQENRDNLDNLFNNNEELYKNVQERKQNYLIDKEKKRKKILKLQKEHNLSYEQAEKLYDVKESNLKLPKLNFENLLTTSDIDISTGMDECKAVRFDWSKLGEPPIIRTKTKDINLDDDICEDDNDNDIDDSSFWK